MPALTPPFPQTEGLHTEFKTSFSDEVIETLVAFANAGGGAVYVGVTDKGVIRGVMLSSETVQGWINEVKNKTALQIIPDAEELNEGLNEGLKTLLSAISHHPGIQARNLVPMFPDRSPKTIERQLSQLATRNLIRRRGSRKTGGYVIISNP
jgi:predicted HTH transcriptional regulator